MSFLRVVAQYSISTKVSQCRSKLSNNLGQTEKNLPGYKEYFGSASRPPLQKTRPIVNRLPHWIGLRSLPCQIDLGMSDFETLGLKEEGSGKHVSDLEAKCVASAPFVLTSSP
jgi:hypothetical protein